MLRAEYIGSHEIRGFFLHIIRMIFFCSTHNSPSPARDGGENVPGILDACTARSFTYLAHEQIV